MLIAIGVVLWFVTVVVNRATGAEAGGARPMEDIGGPGPVN